MAISREIRGSKGDLVMAVPAAVLIWLSLKLHIVRIPVTLCAGNILHFIDRPLRVRRMALCAGENSVGVFQWKSRALMLRDSIQSGPKAFLVVAIVASPATGPVGKLPHVGVLFVAVPAVGKLLCKCKIPALMTGFARDVCMLS